MSKYKIIKDYDGNDEIELEQTRDEKLAMLEAIEKLGWIFIEEE